MKITIHLLFIFWVSQGFSQANLPKDSIVSILLVSHYHSIDIPLVKHIKRNQDIIYFLNIKDKDMYGFIDANYDLYGTIEDFQLDSLGLFRIQLNVSDVSSGKIIKHAVTIEHKVGTSFFIIQDEKKRFRHTKITCEFHREKLFGVDIP
jgi:hypothetical protein